MSKLIQNRSLTAKHDGTERPHTPKQSLQPPNRSIDNETLINSITGYENDLRDRLEKLEHDAERQARQIEYGECLEFIAQLVELFKHTVVASELKNQNDCHNDTRNHLEQHKSISGNRLLDDKVENIVISKGLTKEQWSCLLYVALSTGDTVEITKVSKKHLHKVHEMASRLLEDVEKNAVIALINAIEKHMATKYFIEK
jgi:hypothetical protein